ncbi:DEAD/DEAH box helicase [Flavilitoribacter nigricans]|uniref:DEAD/DEAH box helicase n=1 Tax=Flavilitoribacter nigricans (strain ATCC 23147 / DSM 23189 / NBRC 102662 / NCIMB 1420 / SS-2) TaxID=1122177 RepID=A0A2D0MYB3_FLAN2|nr:DEAD/DEAH box helicase [Flavilitoribacter nigricans]PHN01118.1 hypothetical protein CRP01_38595 [Flavilitoribacter nigricans DSM 23189 = NBRC 102662]
MTRSEYFESIENSLIQTLDGTKFDNHTKQMFAWRIGARFNRSYDEEFIWQRALYLSSNACRLFQVDLTSDIALKALKTSAEIYEYLSAISEKFDKDFCYILSALCYDIAGYQANALCMMRSFLERNQNKFYSINPGGESINSSLNDENYILFHVQLILLKQIPFAFLTYKRSSSLENDDVTKNEDLLGIYLFDKAIYSWYENILKGAESSFNDHIRDAYRYYLYKGNVFVSQILQLLSCRFDKYNERSIWKTLSPHSTSNSYVWSKYIKLLSNDFYRRFKIKSPKDRRSTFEFWVSQMNAFQQGILLDQESFIIQMPTSAGKTFIAEIAILDCLLKYPDKKCVYVAPFRALTNEKEIELSNNLSKIGYSVSSLSGDYELDEFQNFILETTDVLIATPEKLDLLYRLQNDYFSEVSILVVDEGHIIGDLNERAALLEFLIIRLKRKLPHLKILFISAVMPTENSVEFSKWISKKDSNVIKSPIFVDNEVWQPTRKIIGKFNWISKDSSRITYPKRDFQEDNNSSKIPAFVVNLIQRKNIGRRKFPSTSHRGQTAVALAYKLSENGNVLVFCSRPDWALAVCRAFLYLYESISRAKEEILPYFKENLNSESFFNAQRWLGGESPITKCLKIGVGVHFGDLPEPVRKSVEKDYRSGKLRVLISTNTIGQGLNFPIKSLIIHSLDINPKEDLKVEIRDFWNIIGRAGRAGKETEGQIIFLALNEKDEERFESYTNIDNIKRVESIFKILVQLRVSIGQDDFDNYLKLFSEPYIMSMLVEEVIDTEDQAIVEEIIDNSLFNAQQIDITPLRTGFSTVVQRIRTDVSEVEKLKAFASNGFNIDSNLALEKAINDDLEELQTIINEDNYIELISFILKSFDQGGIQEVHFGEKLEGLNGQVSILNDLIINWITGESIDALYEVWVKSVPTGLQTREKLFVFLSQGLNYRLPWGVTAFIIVLKYSLKISLEDLPSNIQALSSYVKYGVDDKLACFALSLGIKSRELSKEIVEKYDGSRNYQNFMNWLTNLTIIELNTWDLHPFDKENLLDVILKFNTKRFKVEIPKSFEFRIRGTYFSAEAQTNSKDVNVGDNLNYLRDVENEVDPFAIKIFKGSNFLGYVPREFSKPLSVEIDLNEKKYSIVVMSSTAKTGASNNDIHVSMSEIDN